MVEISSDEFVRPCPRRHFPGPRGIPVLGHFLDLRRDKIGFLSGLSSRYGDVAAFRMGSWPALLLSNPRDIEGLVVGQASSLRKSEFLWRQSRAVFGKGILSSHGEDWRRQRGMLTPAFAAKRVHAFADTMDRCATSMVKDWGEGVRPDIRGDMIDLSLRVSILSLFGVDAEGDLSRLSEANVMVDDELKRRVTRPVLVPDWLPLPGHGRYLKGISVFDRFISAVIAERRRSGDDKGDFLAAILAARDESGQPLTDREVRDEAMSILGASHGTSAETLTWALHLLSLHPDIQDRAALEALALPGDRPVAAGDLKALPFIARIVDEVLRLYPAIWLNNRQTVGEVTISGRRVESGTSIYYSPWILQRSERYFDRPDIFDPDRWTRDFSRSVSRFVYMPFGAGPRLCIGRSFSLQHLVVTLASVLRKARFEAVDRSDVPLDPGITLSPGRPIALSVFRRSDRQAL